MALVVTEGTVEHNGLTSPTLTFTEDGTGTVSSEAAPYTPTDMIGALGSRAEAPVTFTRFIPAAGEVGAGFTIGIVITFTGDDAILVGQNFASTVTKETPRRIVFYGENQVQIGAPNTATSDPDDFQTTAFNAGAAGNSFSVMSQGVVNTDDYQVTIVSDRTTGDINRDDQFFGNNSSAAASFNAQIYYALMDGNSGGTQAFPGVNGVQWTVPVTGIPSGIEMVEEERRLRFCRDPNYHVILQGSNLYWNETGWEFEFENNVGNGAGGHFIYDACNAVSGRRYDTFITGRSVHYFANISTGAFVNSAHDDQEFFRNSPRLGGGTGEVFAPEFKIFARDSRFNRLQFSSAATSSYIHIIINSGYAIGGTEGVGTTEADPGFYVINAIGSTEHFTLDLHDGYLRPDDGFGGLDGFTISGGDQRIFIVDQDANITIRRYSPLLRGVQAPRVFLSAPGNGKLTWAEPLYDITGQEYGTDSSNGSNRNLNIDVAVPTTVTTNTPAGTAVDGVRVLLREDLINDGTRINDFTEFTADNARTYNSRITTTNVNQSGLDHALAKIDALNTNVALQSFDSDSNGQVNLGDVVIYALKSNYPSSAVPQSDLARAYPGITYLNGALNIQTAPTDDLIARNSGVSSLRKYLSSYEYGFIPIYRQVFDYDSNRTTFSETIALTQTADANVVDVGTLPSDNRAVNMNQAYSLIHQDIVNDASGNTPVESTTVPILRNDNSDAVSGTIWHVGTRAVTITNSDLEVTSSTITIPISGSSAITNGNTLNTIRAVSNNISVNSTQDFAWSLTTMTSGDVTMTGGAITYSGNITSAGRVDCFTDGITIEGDVTAVGDIVLSGDNITINGNVTSTTGDIDLSGQGITVTGTITSSTGRVTYGQQLTHTGSTTAATNITMSTSDTALTGTLSAPLINAGSVVVADSISITTNQWNSESYDDAPTVASRGIRQRFAGIINASSGTAVLVNITHAGTGRDYYIVGNLSPQTNVIITFQSTEATTEIQGSGGIGTFSFNNQRVQGSNVEAEPQPVARPSVLTIPLSTFIVDTEYQVRLRSTNAIIASGRTTSSTADLVLYARNTGDTTSTVSGATLNQAILTTPVELIWTSYNRQTNFQGIQLGTNTSTSANLETRLVPGTALPLPLGSAPTGSSGGGITIANSLTNGRIDLTIDTPYTSWIPHPNITIEGARTRVSQEYLTACVNQILGDSNLSIPTDGTTLAYDSYIASPNGLRFRRGRVYLDDNANGIQRIASAQSTNDNQDFTSAGLTVQQLTNMDTGGVAVDSNSNPQVIFGDVLEAPSAAENGAASASAVASTQDPKHRTVWNSLSQAVTPTLGDVFNGDS